MPLKISALDSANPSTMAAGSGFDGAETEAWSVRRQGGLVITHIVLDLTGLIVAATDGDIIGESAAAANCHFGQITAAVNGTPVAGRMTCLELPAGASTDIDLWTADESTGAENALITDLTGEAQLIAAGGAWANGTVKGFTAMPGLNDYLYLTNGAAANAGTYSAGKFIIEIYGTT